MSSYIPAKEAALLAFTSNLEAKLTAAPTDYGQTIESAAAYAAVQGAFATAYAVANDPATRTPLAIEDKDTKKKTMVEATRKLVQTLQNWPAMTDVKRTDLGIPLRDNEPTPIPPPKVMPRLEVMSVTGRLFELQLQDDKGEKRWPAGVKGANLFSHVGPNPPSDLTQWKFEGGVTRLNPQVVVPDTVAPSTEVWFTALWVNPKLQPGPACAPVQDYTNHSGLSQAA